MKTRYDDALLENRRLQDRIDSMEFVRKNYNSSSNLNIRAPSMQREINSPINNTTRRSDRWLSTPDNSTNFLLSA
jgi:hypothetical protein